jgi:Tol biopolymer transport system component
MSNHARSTIAASLAAVALASILSGRTLATFPGDNGRIAFQRFDSDGAFQIWTANPDLTQQVQITQEPAGAGFASWSPDGRHLAFSSARSDTDPDDGVEVQDVFIMRADGTNVRKLTDSLGDSEKPAWSPDGRWIVFAADRADYPRSQGIYIIPSDGSAAPRRVTTLPTGSLWQELARFSPDGTRIAFTEYRGGKILRNRHEGRIVAEQAALFTVRVDGSDLRQVTPWGQHAGDADWSPDGKQLVFSSQPTRIGDIGDVMVVDADGGHLRNVTNDHGLTGLGRANAFWYEESFNAVWSPDGRKILFVHASFKVEQGFEMGLQTINPDGTGQAWISPLRFEEHQPEWGTAPVLR